MPSAASGAIKQKGFRVSRVSGVSIVLLCVSVVSNVSRCEHETTRQAVMLRPRVHSTKPLYVECAVGLAWPGSTHVVPATSQFRSSSDTLLSCKFNDAAHLELEHVCCPG
jgi:hypothetical protein